MKIFKVDQVRARLQQQGIYLRAASKSGVAEEAPGVYKNIDDVVEIAHNSGIALRVARMRPVGVVKG
jgi:tRNA-splicing ligase RtcB